MNIQTLDSLRLRAAIRQAYAWPGGYDLIFITDDGGTLCAKCARENYYQIAYSRRFGISDGWKIEAIDNGSSIDESCQCDHCGAELSAYID